MTNKIKVVLEVANLAGWGRTTIAMESTDGLTRGMEVLTRVVHPVPVGKETWDVSSMFLEIPLDLDQPC